MYEHVINKTHLSHPLFFSLSSLRFLGVFSTTPDLHMTSGTSLSFRRFLFHIFHLPRGAPSVADGCVFRLPAALSLWFAETPARILPARLPLPVMFRILPYYSVTIEPDPRRRLPAYPPRCRVPTPRAQHGTAFVADMAGRTLEVIYFMRCLCIHL